ncbi:MAG: hypothetical protein GY719_17605 [bacterium]|nr:hypothetical protein [bacterium]
MVEEWGKEVDDHRSPSRRHVSPTLEEAIERSRRIYRLEDNWDDEGAVGYERETWERAIRFLLLHAERFQQETRCSIPAPSIGPGPDGSIDLYWKEPAFGLLVNVPSDEASPATFYGEDKRLTIEGSIATSEYRRGILHWLINR